jgi:hypothetical protein
MRLSLTALLVLFASVFAIPRADAAITFFGISNCPADGSAHNSATGIAYSCTPPSSMVAGDMVIAVATQYEPSFALSNSTTGGQTWSVIGTADYSNGYSMLTEYYCAIFTGTWSGDPSFVSSASYGGFAMSVDLIVYRPGAGKQLSCTPDVALTYGQYNVTTSTITITGQTPTASASVVTLAAWRWADAETMSGLTAGWTTRGVDDDILNSAGGTIGRSFADKIQSSAGATGNVTLTASAMPAAVTSIVTFKETTAAGGSGFVPPFAGLFRGAFHYNSLGGAGGGGGGSSLSKWNPGPYGDCYAWMPHGGDFSHFLGSAERTAFRACVDFYSTQTGVKGVFLPLFWASLEGDTAGSYDGSVGNGLASAGNIGFPLVDDYLSYAASKGIKVILELDWFNYWSDADCTLTNGSAYTIRGLIPGYLLSTACGGSDSTNTYSGAFQLWDTGSNGSPNYSFYLKLWKPNLMARLIAMMNFYAARYDGNATLEKFVLFGEEGDAVIVPTDGSVADGYTPGGLDAQLKRVVSEVKPNWPHTDISLAMAWTNGAQAIIEEAVTSPSKAIGFFSNNTIVSRTSYGECAYLGVVALGVCPNTSTHNYQGELPHTAWLATPFEVCPSPYDRYGYFTFAQRYDRMFVSGYTDSGGRPLKTSHWILGNYTLASLYCPSEVSNNWGLIAGAGVYNYLQTHPTNTACPSKWTGGCDH